MIKQVKSLRNLFYPNQRLLIIDKGRTQEERSVIQIENGKYIGFGYININDAYVHFGSILDCIKIYEDNKDVQQILRTYLNNHKIEKIIRY